MNSRQVPWAPSLVDLLREGAAAQPDAACLNTGGRTTTYGELLDRSASARDEIARQLGARQPRVIAVLASDVVDLLAAELASMSLGADVLLLDARTPRSQLADSLSLVGCPPLVAYEPLEAASQTIYLGSGARLPHRRAHPDALPPSDRGGRLAFQSLRAADAPVVLSREAILADASVFLSMTDFPARGIWFNCLPAQSVNGQQTIAAMWLRGSCLATSRFSADSFWDDVASAGAYAVTVLGSMAQSLIRSGQRAPSCAKAALGGSFISDPAPIFEAVSGVTLLNTFGTPMVGLVSASTLASRRLGSVGRPAPSVDVRFTCGDATGSSGPGDIEVGKLHRALGFLLPDGTIESSPARDGYIRLVERGHLDDEGFLFVSEWPGLLRRSGESIAHATILRRLGQLEGVVGLEVVTNGHEGEWERYRLRATIGRGTKPDRDRIASVCEERLPRFMRPDDIEVVLDESK